MASWSKIMMILIKYIKYISIIRKKSKTPIIEVKAVLYQLSKVLKIRSLKLLIF
jgi:hypothetical protein